MNNQKIILNNYPRRRLTDLYRLPGFQTKASMTLHPIRPNAVIVHLRRLKKIWGMFLLLSQIKEAA